MPITELVDLLIHDISQTLFQTFDILTCIVIHKPMSYGDVIFVFCGILGILYIILCNTRYTVYEIISKVGLNGSFADPGF